MTIIRILLGIFFLISGSSKLFSMESFELYIFSMDLMSFDLCALAARFCIIFELIVGLCYVTGVYRRWNNWAAMASLIIFSAFLGWRLAVGDSRSCHCMGNLADLTPFDSLVKNALLMVFMIRLEIQYHNDAVLLKRRANAGPCAATGAAVCTCGCSGPAPSKRTVVDDFFDRWRKWALGIFVVASVATVFAVTPPDSLRRIGRSSSDLVPEMFEAIAPLYGLDEGRHVVCFYSTFCEHCQHCVTKMAGIINRHSLPLAQIQCFFMHAAEEQEKAVEDFFNQHGAGLQLDWHDMSVYEFIPMTNGSMPLVVLVEDGKAVKEFDYISLDESEITDWLSEK